MRERPMSQAKAAPARLRFAPSPTGSLHLGNARTALFNWLVARQAGGRLVLRIEDTDLDREHSGAKQGILDDLHWLGLDWDEGPDVGGEYGPYRQSERSAGYLDAASQLLRAGRAYRCFCEERELEAERRERLAQGKSPHYRGRCRGISVDESDRRAAAGEPFALRFVTNPSAQAGAETTVGFVDRLRGPVEFPMKELGDTVILRRDGRPTYNFAVVVDDAAMRIDLVLRGDDHLSNTPRQVLLFEALGRRPPEFVHLPMVRGPDGGRLSKRHGAVSLGEYRRRGYPVNGLINALALLGWAPGEDRTLVSREELLREFDIDRISRSPATFDEAKLDWICSQHLQKTPVEHLVDPIHQRLADEGLLPRELPPESREWMVNLGAMVKNSISHFDQVPQRCVSLFYDGIAPVDEQARAVLEDSEAVRVIEALARDAERWPPLDLESWKRVKADMKQHTGAKGKALFRPLRVAITGRTFGPELDALVPLIDRGSVLFPERIRSVADRVRRTKSWLAAR
jgi:glutamyl-tRNA synthetase